STSSHSPAIPKLPKAGGDRRIEPRRLGLLFPQRGHKPLHLLVERLAVVLDRLGTDETPRREHVPVLANLLERSALAEPRYVGVLPSLRLAPPSVVRIGDPRDVLVG